MQRNDMIRLEHMLETAQEAVLFASGKSRQDLAHNRMLTLSIIKAIEIIGEAASKVTADTQQQYPDVPWAGIVAMRNRLIHVYFDIDLDRVWDTVIDDLPPLILRLEKIILAAKRL